MSLETILAQARTVVAQVQGKMTIGASNKLSDQWPPLIPQICVLASRHTAVSVNVAPGVPDWLQEAAAKAEATGCGNCGEQAALAFMALHRQQIAPLDYMARTHADHAFVVIGRVSGSRADRPATWGPLAVVCDPWDEKAYAATEIGAKMYRSLSESALGYSRLEPECWARLEGAGP